MKSACVVVPVHSSVLSQEGAISLKQCYKILSKYDIFLLHPLGLDISSYKKINPNLASLPINPNWLSSIKGYNKLKYSSFFYDLFSDYEYLLTYELDAFVFKDELDYWISKGYDYIGAPLFEGFTKPKLPLRFIQGGNSGFSLRKISACLNVLKAIEQMKAYNNIYSNLKLNKLVSFSAFLKYTLLYKLFRLKSTFYLYKLVSGVHENEDVFWSIWVSSSFRDFKLAPHNDALKFSFEVSPEELYKMNNNKLPFGCHAWLKYNYSFWKPFISSN